MRTSDLVGPDTQSLQATIAPDQIDTTVLTGATDRVGAYSRLKKWLRLPAAEAAAAALAFRNAVATLPHEEQQKVIAAEEDALRHGFSFLDFQKLKTYALKAIEDPYAAVGTEDEQSPYLVAAMLALSDR